MRRIVELVVIILMPCLGIGRGHVRYSPYAFSYNYPSGLVPDYVRYHPYAFSYNHPSGLIDMYSGYPYPYYFPPYDCPPPLIVQPSRPPDPGEAKRITKPRKPRENDGKWIIYNYIKSKGLDIDIVDGFYYRNETVNAVFLVRSKNLIIKYRNPELEKSLEKNPLWARYKKRLEEKEKEYQAAGWKIGNIIANR